MQVEIIKLYGSVELAPILGIADEILEIKATGGTIIRNAIEWAEKNFKKQQQSKIKINIMFTDAEVYDIGQTEKKLKEMVSDGVQFIFVVPKFGYSGQLAEKLKEWTNGIILSIENWKDFPEQVSKLIK
jgi:ATP phosphoribosyltransferase